MRKLFFTVFLALVLSSTCYSASPSIMYGSGEHTGHGEPYLEEDGDRATEVQNIRAADKTTSALIGTSENIVFRDSLGKEQLPDHHTLSIGAEAAISKSVKTYNIPLSYGLPVNFLKADREYLNFSLKVPYTSREIGNLDDSGLGDIKLSVDYLTKFNNLLINSVFLVKFASGDYDDADVPLGTGSTDYGLSVNAKMYFDKFSIKGGLGYVLTGNYSKKGEKVKYGDEYIISAGGEYNITDYIFAGGEFIYNAHQEDEYSFPGYKNKHSGLNTFDFIPSFTYLLKKYNLGITAKVVIPVSDSWNGGDGPDPKDPDRDLEFKFQLSRPF